MAGEAQPAGDITLGMDLLVNARKRVQGGSDAISIISGSGSEKSAKKQDWMFEDAGTGTDTASESGSDTPSSSAQRRAQRLHSKARGTPARPASVASSSVASRGRKSPAAAAAERNSDEYWMRKPRDEVDALNLKRELLYEFERMRVKGYKLPRAYTMDMPLEEVQSEYMRIKRDRDLDSGVMFQRQLLMTCVSGIEFLSSVTPFDARLDGWSHHVSDSIDSYDDVLEELYMKYRGSAKMAPELRLLMALGGSAVMFSMQNRMASMAESFMRGQGQGQASSARPGGGSGGLGGMLGGLGSMLGGLFGGGAQPQQHHNAEPAYGSPAAAPMQGPSLNVESVLKNLQQNAFDRAAGAADNQRVEIISTISDLSDIPDDISVASGAQPVLKPGAKGRRTLNLGDL